MSRTIDEKVVQMQFDNRQFETNVRTSIGTLDKLKQSLRLDDAAKGLDGISNAARKFDISPMGNSVEAVKMKFSALEVMAITVLSNITNSAVNYGKRLVSAFTLEPIETGFQEYELKMGSVQTIMASTGESLETVNRYLEELNEYSDKTIYSFSDMTQNIGKFTNAGVKLEDAVKAIKGISNEAAVSGANANEASRAMYNFAQALSSGYVKLIDWKSIENANMATVEFKQQLIETAVACGTLTDNLDGTYTTLEKGTVISATQNFNDSLQEQWMTTEVLVTTLGKYADETTDIGKKAYAAAQDVKTFSMMMDTLKEAAQSGWAQTWELLVGDFEEAKTLFTELSERFGKMIDDSSKARNNFLKGALDSKWDQFTDQINEAGIATDKFEDQLKKTLIQHGVIIEEEIEKEGSLLKVLQKNSNAKKIIVETLQRVSKEQSKLSDSTKEITSELEKFQKIINQVINGEFGDGTERIEALNKAGYDGVAVQKLVDKIWKKNGETFKDTTITAEDLTDIIKDLSKEELENIGFTEEQAKKLKELADQAAITGTPINKLIDDILTEKPSGRELLIDSLRNALDALMNVLGTVKKAWNNVFTPMSSDKLYEIIETFHKFTERMVKATENTEGLQNALEGLFTVLKIVKDVITKIIGIGIKFGWKILKPIAKFILDVASAVGKLITKTYGLKTKLFKPFSSVFESISSAIEWFSDFLEKKLGAIGVFINDAVDAWNGKFVGTKIFETTGKFISGAVSIVIGALIKLHDCIKKIDFSGIINNFKAIGNFFVELFDTFKNSEFGSSVIESIKKVFDKVYNFVKNFKLPKLNSEKFISSFSKFLDFMSQNNLSGIGGGIIGLFKYLKQQLSYKFEDFNNKVLLAFSNFYLKYGETIKAGFKKFGDVIKAIITFIVGSEKVDLPTIMNLAKSILGLAILFKTFKILDNVTGAFEGISESFENISKSIKWKAIGSAFTSMAIALGVFSACLYVISKMPAKEAYRSLGILSGVLILMGGIVAGLTFLASKIKGGLNMAAVTAAIFGISLSLAILIFTLKKIDGTNFEHLGKSLGILFAILFSMTLSIRMIGKACSGASLKSAAAIITLLTSLKMVLSILEDYSKFPWGSVKKAIPRMVGMLLGLALVLRVASGGLKQGANSTGLALLMISIVVSLKVLLNTIKELADMNPDEMWQGIKGILAILGGISIMLGVINLTNKGGVLNKGQKAINQFKGLAVALLAVALTVKFFGTMPLNELKQGGTAIIVVLGMFSLLFRTIGKSFSKNFNFGSMVALVLGMGILIIILGKVVKNLSSVGWANAIASAGALSTLLIVMTGCLRTLTKHNNKQNTIDKWVNALLGMTAIVGLLSVILLLSNGIDPVKSITQTASLSILLGIMTGCLLSLTKHSQIKEENIYKWIKALGGLALVVTGLALVLLFSNGIDPVKAITQVTAISELLVVMSGCLLLLNKFGKVNNNIYDSIIALAVLGAVVAELSVILKFLDWLDIEGTNIISKVTAISILLLGMSECILICSKVGQKAFAALPALGVLALFAIGLTAFLAVLGGIDKIFKGGFVDVMERSVRIMELIGLAIGKLIGGIVGGIGAAIIATLPQMGKDLSDFMDNASGFFNGLRSLEADMLAKAGVLTGIIGVLTYESMLNGLANILTIGHSLPNLGTDLGKFMKNAMPFFNGLEKIPENATTSVKNLADAIMTLTTASFLDGIGKLIGLGKGNFETFGTSIAKFGSSLSVYAESIRNLTDDDLNKISLSSAAGEKLSELARKIPNEGGVAGWLFGENNIGTFGTSIVEFGKGLVSYAESIKALTDDDITKIETSCEAGEQLSTLAGAIPNEGGVAGWLFGENNIGTFGTSIVEFGKNLVEYAETVRDLTAGDEKKIASSAEAAKSLSNLADSIPNEDGAVSWLFGDNKISTFGESIVSFGESLMSYAKKVRSFTKDDITKISLSKKAADELVKVAKAIPNDKGLWGKIAGDQNLSKFGIGMTDLAKGLAEYAKTAKGIDDNAVKSIKKSKEAVEAMSDAAKKVPNEGSIWEIFTGKNDISNFGTGMVSLALGLIAYVKVARQITDDDTAVIDRSTLAIMAIATAAKVIPNSGGLGQLIMGENDINSFSTGIILLATGIKDYAEKVKDIDTGTIMSIMLSTLAISAIIKVAKTIPNSGGLGQLIMGENDIDSFVTGMKKLATGIIEYATTVSAITIKDIVSIGLSALAINAITEAAKTIPNSGGLSAKIFGDNADMQSFITGMKTIATGIIEYSSIASSITAGTIKNIFVSGIAIITLADVSATIKSSFGSSNNLSGAIQNVNQLIEIINKMSLVKDSNVSGFVNAMKELSTVSIDEFTNGFSGGAGKATLAINNMLNTCVRTINSKRIAVTEAFIKIVSESLNRLRSRQSEFRISGETMMKMFATGIRSGASTAKNAMTSACKSCINSISLYYGSFLSAGFSLAKGFSQGITIGTFMAATAARAMASAAFQAAKDELDINSPSKKFRKMAGCVPEGFAQGIDRLSGMVKKSSVNMAQIALDSTQGAISQISRVVDGNMDISPTIRPVVNMDSISTERLQLFSNIDTMISQPVDTWSQRILDAQSEINSSNNEVIRAIGNLRDDLKLMYDMVDAKDTNLYMDTKRVASSLAKPMNRELSILAKRGSN